MAMLTRCAWVGEDPREIAYHDNEWGVPTYDDQRLFEFLLLEGAQAGLSWSLILQKRENYRQAFDGFDARLVSQYDEIKQQQLLENIGIVRNRLKIKAAIVNANKFLKLQSEFDNFSTYIWKFVSESCQNCLRKSETVIKEIEIQSVKSF